jgi:hypothetical protein
MRIQQREERDEDIGKAMVLWIERLKEESGLRVMKTKTLLCMQGYRVRRRCNNRHAWINITAPFSRPAGF